MKKAAKSKPGGAAQVREYIAALPPAPRRAVKALRAAILSAAPGVEETISYGIPTFKLDGRPLVYCAGFQHHVSLYPMTAAIRRAHADALEGYKMSTGTVQFPLDAPLPLALVKRLVKARLSEHKGNQGQGTRDKARQKGKALGARKKRG